MSCVPTLTLPLGCCVGDHVHVCLCARGEGCRGKEYLFGEMEKEMGLLHLALFQLSPTMPLASAPNL